MPTNSTLPSIETVEIVTHSQTTAGLWEPVEGEEAQTLLSHLQLPDDDSAIRIRDEAINVLRHCIPPTVSSGNETGLIIGYVQSGKTMSFTTVAALARDNGYQVVIVVAGTSESLLAQSMSRLQKDLQLSTRRKWRAFENPSLQTGERDAIADTLAEWREGTVQEADRQAILITVMKNHKRLKNLYELLSALGDLAGVPTLIVDDEADQASMNTKVRDGEESTTHQRLALLRQKLPNHTFLQYTATPQAPLLINLIDVLSPRFTELLTPGQDYTGGRSFFIDSPQLIRDIPSADIPASGRGQAVSPRTAPPPSLHEAMRLFFLGVAAAYVFNETDGKNRSMMIHPSEKQALHQQYLRWVKQARNEWRRILALDQTDADRRELLSLFEEAYADLSETIPNLPPFDQLVDRLPYTMGRTEVQLKNSTREGKRSIDWGSNYPFILVGGMAMDRGFTVEGLTVTYMPRGMGVGNADTIQQRARFFGYKRAYLGYCRVFLETVVHQAFRQYVRHEDDVHQQLQTLLDQGRNLTDWKRAFFLDNALRPTRSNVLGLDYIRGNYSDRWFTPSAPHDLEEATSTNRQVVMDFTSRLTFSPDQGDVRRTEAQKHLVASDIPLSLTYEQLLTLLRVTRLKDSQRFTGLLLQVRAYLEEHPDETCTVYKMSGGRLRERSVNNDTDNEIPELFQGQNPSGTRNPRDIVYLGDGRIRASQGMTIQLHTLRVLGPARGAVIADNVPAVAVWLPHSMSYDWISQ
jgi:hypothetical protein